MCKINSKKVKTYKHLFFDLDNTLWDFSFDTKKAFEMLFCEFDLLKKSGLNSGDLFIKSYKKHNLQLWKEYKKGTITKEYLCFERFKRPLEDFGCYSSDLAQKLSVNYICYLSNNVTLFPEALGVLNYLKEKYTLHAITNGFEEIQSKKLNKSGLINYFNHIITSEMADAKKPDPAIYRYSLIKANAIKNESLMIGDDPESDIEGSFAAGIDQCWLNLGVENNDIKPTYEIKNLDELKNFL